MGVSSLPKTVTRQSRLRFEPRPSAPESSTLTARLPSHPWSASRGRNINDSYCYVFLAGGEEEIIRETGNTASWAGQDDVAEIEHIWVRYDRLSVNHRRIQATLHSSCKSRNLVWMLAELAGYCFVLILCLLLAFTCNYLSLWVLAHCKGVLE